MGNLADTQELILLGGGHSHALALRMLGMDPLTAARLTVVSNVSHTPYSGMLPGYVSGQYSYDETHIDLRRLAAFAGARFILEETVGLDLDQKQIQFSARPALDFDLLSINIGSTPFSDAVPGAAQHATPVKPVPAFLKTWQEIVDGDPDQPRTLIIVGGGAGGVELAMSIKKRLGQHARVHLVNRSTELLPSHTPRVRTLMARLCEDQGIALHRGESVTEVRPNEIAFESGKTLQGDHLFWVTHASPAPWIQSSGLAVDDAGFMSVTHTLQSTSHDFVFGAGDVASMRDTPRPKSGVYAVRQAKPLLANLRAYCTGMPLRPYRPQKSALALICTGAAGAVASNGRVAHLSPLMLRIKDRIDRQFMQKFSDLPDMTTSPANAPGGEPDMRCLGCAAKAGAPLLTRALERVRAAMPPETPRDDIVIGLDAADDASAIRVPDGKVLVQSKDYFPALLSDPWIMGRILALHGFSDIFAMGATPHSALALMLLPYGSDRMMESDLVQCLAGMTVTLDAMGAVLLGGHTAEADQLGMGITCNGLADPDGLLRKQGLQDGDALILTQALGTGALFAAHMRRQARGRWIDQALDAMLNSNQAAASMFTQYGAKACTDVTGFGLLGHLGEMLQGSTLGAALQLDALPALPGAVDVTQAGVLSTLDPMNRKAEALLTRAIDHAHYDLLFDPQTSGGLLAGIPASHADACLADLRASQYPQAALIGHVTKPADPEHPISLHT